MANAGLNSTLTLNSGCHMPVFGLGVSKMENVAEIVSSAIHSGYRLIDTAERYGNEKEVGEGLKLSSVPREQLFIVTKTFQHGKEYCRNALKTSLDKLGLSYVDLYLIHSPYDIPTLRQAGKIDGSSKILETYDAMLEMRDAGLIRSVGVSNFGVQHLEGLIQAGRPAPAVNQIEINPWTKKEDIVNYCKNHGIQVMGYSPICKGEKLDEPGLVKIAAKYNKTPAQIAIRWSLQRGYVTIPKTSSEKRLKENADVFDVVLTEDDMEILNNFKFWECRLWPSDPTQLPWNG